MPKPCARWELSDFQGHTESEGAQRYHFLIKGSVFVAHLNVFSSGELPLLTGHRLSGTCRWPLWLENASQSRGSQCTTPAHIYSPFYCANIISCLQVNKFQHTYNRSSLLSFTLPLPVIAASSWPLFCEPLENNGYFSSSLFPRVQQSQQHPGSACSNFAEQMKI